jgi:signal transduction histidine kinase
LTEQAAALELRGRLERPDRSEQVTWLFLGPAAYLALGLLGRAAIADGEAMSLVWPAAGAAALLFGLTNPRMWWLCALLVAAATAALNLFMGASGTEVALFIASNLVQAVGVVLILRALAPDLRVVGGARPLEHMRDFWPVMAASVAGSLIGAAVRELGQGLLLDTWSWVNLVVWWARSATGTVVVVTTGALALSLWEWLHQPDDRARVVAAVRQRWLETGMLLAFTIVTYVGVFVWYSWLPVAFSLLVPTVWAGLRFGPLPVALHSLVVCTTVVVFTLAGRGSFADVGSWRAEVLISQLFIALVFCLGTLLALGRGERHALTRTISSARAESEAHALFLSTVIESMHEGVSLIDESGQVVLRNSAGALLSRTELGTTGHVYEDAFTMMTTDGEEMTEADHPWVRAFASDGVVEQDMVLVFDDGSPSRTLAVTARRLPPRDDGGLDQALVIYHDVTTDRAQRSALESFAGVVAHDLLGPLAVIDGWNEMLELDLAQTGTLTEDDAAPKLTRIRRASEGMRRLIGDLLESATSRSQQLRLTVVDLDREARSIAKQRTEVATGEVPRIVIDPLPAVHADPGMVRQLLGNLIGNAIKYVEPGEVPHVRLSAREVKGRIEVTVADQGIGIPTSQRDQIFEAFQRAQSAEGYDGHGIGLAVCKTIVERHGGTIAAWPPVGDRGARIVFTLPAATATAL